MAIQDPSYKSFYKDKKNARAYIESCEGMDGRSLIEILENHLKPNSTILELGIGAGTDLDILNETFNVTGSDYSQSFLDLYKNNDPNADLLLLDAISVNTNRKFDCIYSNKVLHHLSTKDLITSLIRQKHLLNRDGILFHTFWHGVGRKKIQDLHFIKYKVNELIDLAKSEYKIIAVNLYAEMNLNDSIYIILKAH